jgi:hypothetical protein
MNAGPGEFATSTDLPSNAPSESVKQRAPGNPEHPYRRDETSEPHLRRGKRTYENFAKSLALPLPVWSLSHTSSVA